MEFFRPAKFTNISSITVFFPASQGANEIRIYYLGFLGQWTEVSANAIAVDTSESNGSCLQEKGRSNHHCVRSAGESG